ncbi:hypothetical protein D3C72_1255870 [compost metagenome]
MLRQREADTAQAAGDKVDALAAQARWHSGDQRRGFVGLDPAVRATAGHQRLTGLGLQRRGLGHDLRDQPAFGVAFGRGQHHVDHAAMHARVFLADHLADAAQRGLLGAQRLGAGDVFELVGDHGQRQRALARVERLHEREQAEEAAFEQLGLRLLRGQRFVEAPEVVDAGDGTEVGRDLRLQAGVVVARAGAQRPVAVGRAREGAAALGQHHGAALRAQLPHEVAREAAAVAEHEQAAFGIA